ncbi:radical SAM peptide maturase, CXXX-repeat target family [Clostridium sp. 19966]|uniref:radical SAM peptide maturase, CXXX-repeat target family n=1 Tax=Clostridium sp. 19966 TaxID=2768166 RepID=UPI0028DEDC6A|nr:radical SAM peptide maturase, CXXX-repeat target family [Clostridium sp. 19966]MDT8719431.1 radical SAM peptide maturase, CXXX-repeat target family [Clostridium sp. 19966]
MEEKNVLMGQLDKGWTGNGKSIKTITFCVTEACNLACKYCYMVGKNNIKKLTFDIAKKAVDYILEDREFFDSDSVIWDFIGGEPFLEIDLIDRICDYIKQKMFLIDHPWFESYRFSFSSNGILYNTAKVQRFIDKNKGHLSVGLSVDGNKIKHDTSRVYPDGRGSYDDVIKNVPLWLEQFPSKSTKATFSHLDLPYLKDSIINLWNIGIKIVAANVVFEDAWEENDDIVFENQLKELADYVIEHKLWDEFSVRFFDPNIGLPLDRYEKDANFCGAGKMLAIDCEGNFFPCIRFLDFALCNKKGRKIGSVYTGINNEKVRAFQALDLLSQSDKKCVKCDVATGCAWCTGANYDFAATNTIYQRSTYICKMHKANVRANEYFWKRYSEVTGKISPLEINRLKRLGKLDGNKKYLQFILSDEITPHCRYKNWRKAENMMSQETFKKAIDFCEVNNITPVMLGKSDEIFRKYLRFDSIKSYLKQDEFIPIIKDSKDLKDENMQICIQKVSLDNLFDLYKNTREILKQCSRVNIVLEDIDSWGEEEIDIYKLQLDMIRNNVLKLYSKGVFKEINVLTDRLDLRYMDNCDCGEDTFALAPNGKIYICPAFYFYDESSDIGNLNDGISIKNDQLLRLDNSPICSKCDSFQCNRCKFLNWKITEELNVPSKKQCVISHIEREQSRLLQEELIKAGYIEKSNIIEKLSYSDPLEFILSRRG